MTPTASPRWTPTIDPAPLALPLTCEARGSVLARARKVVAAIDLAIVRQRELVIYAQVVPHDFWYKVYFFTRYGVLKSDTSGESLDNARSARLIIRSQKLRPVPLNAVMRNWQTHGLWEQSRPLSTALLALWQRCQDEGEAT